MAADGLASIRPGAADKTTGHGVEDETAAESESEPDGEKSGTE
jgi:hypothetical protein